MTGSGRSSRVLLLLMYLLSGACGLVYEVVWTRRLSLTFGITVFATSAVLAAFMAGLGLGSYLIGRRIDHSSNPIRVYAWLEAGIGLYALVVPWIFEALGPVHVALGNALEGHFLLFNFARGLVAFLVFLIPTTMMGGTVPAMGRIMVRRLDSVGMSVALFYAINTLGAVLGVLAAGFVMIGSLGMWRTTMIAASVNIGIAAVLLILRVGEKQKHVAAPTPAVPARAGGAMRPVVLLAWLVIAGSGLAAMAYEVVWTRVLLVHLHNTTYAFSTMLAVFLFGLAAGDAILMRFYDRIQRPLFWLGALEVLIGISVILATRSYQFLGSYRVPFQASWMGALSMMFLKASVVLLPGALLLGMTFPMVSRIVVLEMKSVGRDVGGVYAANTVGGILGSLAGGFLLIPLLGLRNTLIFLCAFNVVLGIVCWFAATKGVKRLVCVPAALVVVLANVAVPHRLFFHALQPKGYKLIYYDEGITDTTGVWEKPDRHRNVTYGDLRGTAGTATNRANRISAHIPHLLHPHPVRSLQICFGVGNTLAAAALYPEVTQLDCVELSPHVRQTASYFWTNNHVLDNPKVNLIIDDGRSYLQRTKERYDVVTLEPPHIFEAGVVNLYTREFYQLIRNVLTDNGVVCQWFPVVEMGDLERRMLFRAFQDVFPNTTMWRVSPYHGLVIFLVGTVGPTSIDLEDLQRRMNAPGLKKDLERVRIATPDALFELFVAGPEGTREYIGDAPPVTDDLTYVDFSVPRSEFSNFGFGFGDFDEPDPETKARKDALWKELQEFWTSITEPISPLLKP